METPQQARDEIIDEEHLRLLSLGHYITGGLCIAFASIFIFHFVFMLLGALYPEMFAGPNQTQQGQPDAEFFLIFAVVIGLVILAGWTFGGLTIYVGRCIKRRTHRTLTFVMACLNTMFIPFGTILGVFTLIVLSRPNVKRLYGL
jgi:hypothetical protein